MSQYSVDLLRCSITFNTCEEMVSALNEFKSKVNSSEMGYVTKIFRIKNGFKDVLKWTKTRDFGYRDIKFNVAITDINSDKNNKKQVIGEIQFLASFMLDAKKRGHSIYAVLRRNDFVNEIRNLMQHDRMSNEYNTNTNINGDGQETDYSFSSIINKNTNKKYHLFSKELLLNERNILTAVVSTNNNNNNNPLLYELTRLKQIKACKLFYSSMLHFDYAYNLNKEYINNYINFGDNDVVNSGEFYGIPLSLLDSNNANYRSFVGKILASPQFGPIKVCKGICQKNFCMYQKTTFFYIFGVFWFLVFGFWYWMF